jgi:hypothetical protein
LAGLPFYETIRLSLSSLQFLSRMKCRLYFLAGALIWISFLARAKESEFSHLSLNRPCPRTGDRFEIAVESFTTSANTNVAQEKEAITNSCNFLELTGDEKVLNWDAVNNQSKVEITLDRFETGNDKNTNMLSEPGTKLIGTSLLDESFFEPQSGVFSEEARGKLKEMLEIRPRFFNEFAHTAIPQPVFVGETWQIPAPTNIESMTGILGASFDKDTKATGELVGTTNLFGFNCFIVRLSINYAGTPEFLRQVAARLSGTMSVHIVLTVDLIVPFDASQVILVKRYCMDVSSSGATTINGQNAVQSHGQFAMKIASVFRPLPRK